MNLVFILVEPATPENVGAAARALKTMGFPQLRLVNPCNYLSNPARWLAHASNDILEAARVYSSLKEAVADCNFCIGTTAKQRSVKEDYLNVCELPALLQKKETSIHQAGVIFGREDSGLRNQELKRCDVVSTVPLQTSYPSLNLAQAVMLYAYELSVLHTQEPSMKKDITPESFQALKQKTATVLTHLKFTPNSAIYPRIIERLNQLSHGDIQLLHSICNKYFEKNSKC